MGRVTIGGKRRPGGNDPARPDAIRSSSLQHHEAAGVRQMPSLPFVAEPGSADHFRQIPDPAILSTRNMFGCSRESAEPYESLEPDELDELMGALEPFATLLLAAQD